MRLPSLKSQIVLILITLAVISQPAWADKRDWLLTYPYWTESKGEFEVEEWHNAGDSIKETPEERIEFEYGISNRLSSSIYVVRQAGSLQNLGWQFENRYRLAEPGTFFVDPAIYLEYRNNSPVGQPGELEGKLILQKYVGNLALATNLVFEKTLGGDNTSVRFDRFHVATAYPLTPTSLDGGVEFTRYLGAQVTSVTPGLYGSLTEDIRYLIGWEIPVAGNASSRIRTGFSLEF